MYRREERDHVCGWESGKVQSILLSFLSQALLASLARACSFFFKKKGAEDCGYGENLD